MRSVLGVHWKDWCWSWNSNPLATWSKELTHLKRPWCWERLRAGGEGNNRGGDGWMASSTRWTWVWVDSRSWWWTGRSGVLQVMWSQRVGHDWETELNWTYRAPSSCQAFFLYTLSSLSGSDLFDSSSRPLPGPTCIPSLVVRVMFTHHIHSLKNSRCLCGVHCVPGMVPDSENTVVSKIQPQLLWS